MRVLYDNNIDLFFFFYENYILLSGDVFNLKNGFAVNSNDAINSKFHL